MANLSQAINGASGNPYSNSVNINNIGHHQPSEGYHMKTSSPKYKELINELGNYYDVMDLSKKNAIITSSSFREQVVHVIPPEFLIKAIKREYGKKPLRIAFTQTSLYLKVTLFFIDTKQYVIKENMGDFKGMSAARFTEWILNLAAYEQYCDNA